MAWVANVRGIHRCGGEAADADHRASSRKPMCEENPAVDLGPRRLPVRGGRSGMGRHDVPAKHLVLEAELPECDADDRGGRFAGALTRQLALRGERKAADACTAVARRLADEQKPGGLAGEQVAREATPQQTGTRSFAIEVER